MSLMDLLQHRTTWTTQDHRELAPPDFTDDHLLNTLGMIHRNAPPVRPFYDLLHFPSLPAHLSEAAQDAALQDLEAHAQRGIDVWLRDFPLYRALCAEAVRRGLVTDLQLDAQALVHGERYL